MHFISLSSNDLLSFLLLKDKIKKLKKQAKRICILINKKQLLNYLPPAVFFRIDLRKGGPSKRSGAATGFRD
ncbi:hypothetical protein DB42_AA00020 [Neochlamydia sp. EPS4]|nr:hypothetical protein DB42_AA00020 [Neochlamydia sp. EPS4]